MKIIFDYDRVPSHSLSQYLVEIKFEPESKVSLVKMRYQKWIIYVSC